MAFVVCALLRSTRVGGVGAGAGVQSWNEVVLEKITTFMNVIYLMQKNLFKRLSLQMNLNQNGVFDSFN